MPDSSEVAAVDLTQFAGGAGHQPIAQVVWTNAGQKLSERPFSTILRELGFDVQALVIKEARYEDPYFYTPAEWATFRLLLREFRFAQNSVVSIRTVTPVEGRGYFYRMPYGGPISARCGLYAGNTLIQQDAEAFANHVENNCHANGLGSIRIEYTNERMAHSRILTLICEENGVEKVHRIIFDRGLDLLNFSDRSFTVPLFAPAIENWVKYSGSFYIGVFFRMRKRHLLPALHDGMQGDEDGMQTCERPPLWAFGWPRGGVHMFTSLHVACLARVA